MRSALALALLLFVACGPNYATELAMEFDPITVLPPPDPPKAAELGTGDHTAASVTLTVIAGPASGLRNPRDIAFNPRRPDELWAVNEADNSVVIVTDASKDTRSTQRLKDSAASHFMEHPSSLAFGGDATTIGKLGTFATCQESRNTFGGAQPANDFMGPALWSSDLTVFAQSDPMGLGAHLDMLHGSPNCMGIAHERDNIYWVFGGKAQSGSGAARQAPIPAIVKYNFNMDHGIGRDDHADGEIYQYAENQVADVPGIPSHLVFEQATKLLWIADTGNARVVTLDTMTGTRSGSLTAQEPLRAYDRMTGATLTEVVPAGMLGRPSGIELKGEYVYVADNATGIISAFTKAGVRVNYLETGLPNGAITGLAFGPDEKLYFIDMPGNRVLRIDPK